MDLIDNCLTMPKCRGYLDMFNGIDIVQTKYYIKIDCHTYVKKFCKKYLDTWLCKLHLANDRSTPLPTNKDWIKGFI
jgi:hypothetical protein